MKLFFEILNIEFFREYCLSKLATSEHLPFDDRTLVFKVANKMFALCDIMEFNSVNLKCDPERAEELRDQYDGIQPGYHMSKKHWNTVDVKGAVPDQLIIELIDHSYELIVKSLPKKVRETLN